MIGAHPGGTALTGRLLALSEMTEAGAASGAAGKALDLGAGAGESVRYLRALGYEAEGIDLDGRAGSEDEVTAGDMTALPYADACFDLCVAECSVSVCGDAPAALREAYRVLRPGGSLLLSDVYFQKESAPRLSMPEPLTFSCWQREIGRAGFHLRKHADETKIWRQFFLESLWNDNADDAFCDFFREAGKAGCGYFLAWLKKPEK